MSLAQASGIDARPLDCSNCGRGIVVPPRHLALLDEQGFALIRCECGAVNRIPFETVGLETTRRRRRPSWQAAALWIVIIGLIALMFPLIQKQTEPEPEPPFYLTT